MSTNSKLLLNFWNNLRKSIGKKVSDLKNPEYYKQKFRENKPEIAGGVIGTGIGTYLGNEMFKNSLPPVRELPKLQQSNIIYPEQAYTNKTAMLNSELNKIACILDKLNK